MSKQKSLTFLTWLFNSYIATFPHCVSSPLNPPKAWRTRPNSMERTKTATMPRVPLQGLSKLMWVDPLRQIGDKYHLVGGIPTLPLWKMMEWVSSSVGMMTWHGWHSIWNSNMNHINYSHKKYGWHSQKIYGKSANIPWFQWFLNGSSHHPVMTTIRPVVDEPPGPLPRYQLISLKFMVAPSATCPDRSLCF